MIQQFLSAQDVQDVQSLVQETIILKSSPFEHKALGQNKTLGLIFFNPSLRTRLSTQRAAQNLGMDTIIFNIGKEGWKIEFEDGAVMDGDSQEHIKDAAAVISQYCDIIGIRTFASLSDREKDYSEEVIKTFAQYATVPIVNLESATVHPLQSLADLVTIAERQPQSRPKVVLSWAPHPRALPQAVSNSFLEWITYTDAEVVITHPEGYELSEKFVGNTPVEYDQMKAFEGADFIYTKNWSSYHSYGQTLRKDFEWMITPEKMQVTNHGKFMHCLPVRRNVVVHDEVIDSQNSIILEQANNRTYAAQMVLKKILEWKASR